MLRTTLAAAIFLTAAGTAMAQSPNPSQLLQGLLSGNQGQDQAVRDAFERGYRRGREDQQHDNRNDRGDRNDRGSSDRGDGDGRGYQNGNGQRDYAPADPSYNR